MRFYNCFIAIVLHYVITQMVNCDEVEEMVKKLNESTWFIIGPMNTEKNLEWNENRYIGLSSTFLEMASANHQTRHSVIVYGCVDSEKCYIPIMDLGRETGINPPIYNQQASCDKFYPMTAVGTLLHDSESASEEGQHDIVFDVHIVFVLTNYLTSDFYTNRDGIVPPPPTNYMCHKYIDATQNITKIITESSVMMVVIVTPENEERNDRIEASWDRLIKDTNGMVVYINTTSEIIALPSRLMLHLYDALVAKKNQTQINRKLDNFGDIVKEALYKVSQDYAHLHFALSDETFTAELENNDQYLKSSDSKSNLFNIKDTVVQRYKRHLKDSNETDLFTLRAYTNNTLTSTHYKYTPITEPTSSMEIGFFGFINTSEFPNNDETLENLSEVNEFEKLGSPSTRISSQILNLQVKREDDRPDKSSETNNSDETGKVPSVTYKESSTAPENTSPKENDSTESQSVTTQAITSSENISPKDNATESVTTQAITSSENISPKDNATESVTTQAITAPENTSPKENATESVTTQAITSSENTSPKDNATESVTTQAITAPENTSPKDNATESVTTQAITAPENTSPKENATESVTTQAITAPENTSPKDNATESVTTQAITAPENISPKENATESQSVMTQAITSSENISPKDNATESVTTQAITAPENTSPKENATESQSVMTQAITSSENISPKDNATESVTTQAITAPENTSPKENATESVTTQAITAPENTSPKDNATESVTTQAITAPENISPKENATESQSVMTQAITSSENISPKDNATESVTTQAITAPENTSPKDNATESVTTQAITAPENTSPKDNATESVTTQAITAPENTSPKENATESVTTQAITAPENISPKDNATESVTTQAITAPENISLMDEATETLTSRTSTVPENTSPKENATESNSATRQVLEKPDNTSFEIQIIGLDSHDNLSATLANDAFLAHQDTGIITTDDEFILDTKNSTLYTKMEEKNKENSDDNSAAKAAIENGNDDTFSKNDTNAEDDELTGTSNLKSSVSKSSKDIKESSQKDKGRFTEFLIAHIELLVILCILLICFLGLCIRIYKSYFMAPKNRGMDDNYPAVHDPVMYPHDDISHLST